jgi:hypothetical protein
LLFSALLIFAENSIVLGFVPILPKNTPLVQVQCFFQKLRLLAVIIKTQPFVCLQNDFFFVYLFFRKAFLIIVLQENKTKTRENS